MHNPIKNILSVISMGLFLLFALASHGVETKFEPEYHEDDCLEETEAIFEPQIDVKVIDKITGHSIPGAWVRVSINFYEGVTQSSVPRCKRVYKFGRSIDSTTGVGGITSAIFSPVAFTTNLDKLIIRIEADIIDYELNKIVLVRTYNSTGKVNVTIPLIPINQL